MRKRTKRVSKVKLVKHIKHIKHTQGIHAKQGRETEATRHIRKRVGRLAAAVDADGGFVVVAVVVVVEVDVANCRRACRVAMFEAWKQQRSGRRARGAAALIVSVVCSVLSS